jgi:hypothetical protein
MKNHDQDETSAALFLTQILLTPSDKIVTDRFSASTDTNGTCGATCSGQCHGFA